MKNSNESSLWWDNDDEMKFNICSKLEQGWEKHYHIILLSNAQCLTEDYHPVTYFNFINELHNNLTGYTIILISMRPFWVSVVLLLLLLFPSISVLWVDEFHCCLTANACKVIRVFSMAFKYIVDRKILKSKFWMKSEAVKFKSERLLIMTLTQGHEVRFAENHSCLLVEIWIRVDWHGNV